MGVQITFEDVKVPVKNLIGEENKGFQLIMANCALRLCFLLRRLFR